MRVSGLDNDLDWRFGKGRAVYKRNADAIAQNILTRLRSFLGDWYLDTEIGIDWLTLLGNLGTEKRILRSLNPPSCRPRESCQSRNLKSLDATATEVLQSASDIQMFSARLTLRHWSSQHDASKIHT